MSMNIICMYVYVWTYNLDMFVCTNLYDLIKMYVYISQSKVSSGPVKCPMLQFQLQTDHQWTGDL